MNDDRLPLSEEVFNQIVVRISEGDWVEGEKLPSESQLCEMFHVAGSVFEQHSETERPRD